MRMLRILAEDVFVDLFWWAVSGNKPNGDWEVEVAVALVGIASSIMSVAKCKYIFICNAAEALI